jgi:outer membrane receptor protein involved in Fe transport
VFRRAVVTLTRDSRNRRDSPGDYVIYRTTTISVANDGTSTYHQWSPRWEPSISSPTIKAYIAYKTGFRAPAPLELACANPTAPCSLPFSLGNDPTLKPVTSNDYEGGVDYNPTSRTFLDVDAFWTDVFNDIVYASPTLRSSTSSTPRRPGWCRVSAQVGLPAGVRIFASYSYVVPPTRRLMATADRSMPATRRHFPVPANRGRSA